MIQYGFSQIDSMQLILISHWALNLTETCENLFPHLGIVISANYCNSKLPLDIDTEVWNSCWSCVHPAVKSSHSHEVSHSLLSIHRIRFREQLFDPAGLTCLNTTSAPGPVTPRGIVQKECEWCYWVSEKKSQSNISLLYFIFFHFRLCCSIHIYKTYRWKKTK